MKKCLIAVAAIFMLSLSGCTFFDYNKATRMMENSDYQAAYQILQSISEYKNAEELSFECIYQMGMEALNLKDYAAAHNQFSRILGYKDSFDLSQECTYQMAMDAYNLEDYETAHSYFSNISEYKDAAQKVGECSIYIGFKSANAMKDAIVQSVRERDENRLCEAILAYLSMEHSHSEITEHMNDYVMRTVSAQFEQPDYENYLFLDRIILLTNNNEMLLPNIGYQLSEYNRTHCQQRTIAFLSGTWKRVDSSQSSGLRISIEYTEENTFAMVLEDLSFCSEIITSAEFHWDKGMLIWNDIQIQDDTHITMDIMWLTSYYNLGVQSNRYEDGVGYLDYEGMRIITQSTGEEDIKWQSNHHSDIYVKESAIKEMPLLSEADFVISVKRADATYHSENINEWFSAYNTLFCVYDGSDLYTTARGISVGSRWSEVVDQYGYGRGNLYTSDNDFIYAKLKSSNLTDENSGDYLCNILSDQSEEYMEYSLKNSNQRLRFYFSDGVVTWIVLFTI